MNDIIYSALRTPDGTLLESRYRHDCVTHQDKNGKVYMLDGGLDYVRRSNNGDEEVITITADQPHEIVRTHMDWGSRGKHGDQPLSYIKLQDMTSNHIQACLDTQTLIHQQIRQAMLNELELRKQEEESQDE